MPPSIPWDRIRGVLVRYPDGLPTAEIAALAGPVPSDLKTPPTLLCLLTLRRHEHLGHVRRAGRRAVPGKPGLSVFWQLPGEHARQAVKHEMAFTSRRIALLQRKIRALAEMEEGIEELEQVEREIAARGPLPRLCR